MVEVCEVLRGWLGGGGLRTVAERVQITEWVGKDLSVVKISDLLARRGVLAPYRTLHRFCTQRCGFDRGGTTTVRVAGGSPTR